MNFILETVNNSLQLMSKNFNETTVDQNYESPFSSFS